MHIYKYDSIQLVPMITFCTAQFYAVLDAIYIASIKNVSGHATYTRIWTQHALRLLCAVTWDALATGEAGAVTHQVGDRKREKVFFSR